MALPTCGSGNRAWAPYDVVTRELLHYQVSRGDNRCDSQTCRAATAPSTWDAYHQCAACASQHEHESLEYGCTWCTTWYAALSYYHDRDSPTRPTLAQVQAYVSDSSQRDAVDALWSTLTPCAQGQRLTALCFRDGNTGPQYAARPSPPPGGSSSAGGGTPVWLWVLIGLVAGLALVVGGLRLRKRLRISSNVRSMLQASNLVTSHYAGEPVDPKQLAQARQVLANWTDERHQLTENDHQLRHITTRNPHIRNVPGLQEYSDPESPYLSDEEFSQSMKISQHGLPSSSTTHSGNPNYLQMRYDDD